MEVTRELTLAFEGDVKKVILSNPVDNTIEYKKIEILPSTVKGKTCYQVCRYTKTQVFQKNVSQEQLLAVVQMYFPQEYEQLHIFVDEQDISLRMTKKGKLLKNINKKITVAKERQPSHNRKKNYLLEEGCMIPPLIDMGVFTKDGKVVRSMYDKYKQINWFIELVDDLLKDEKKELLHIIDFGCGKSYLTFILYYYLVELKHKKVEIIGLDLKADVIKKCNEAGKPVITATQMLDSMIRNSLPTRAEACDICNAIFDGTDALMLSGETAGGKYPVESVKTMALIARTTEDSLEYKEHMRKIDSDYVPGTEVGHMVAHSAYKLSKNIKAKAIIIPTLHGNTARMIGSFRPEQIVIAVTPNKKVQRQLMIQWGVTPVLCRIAGDSDMMIQNAVKLAIENNLVKLSDRVVVCAGIPLSSPLMVNTIRVLVVGNIIARGTSFGFCNSEKQKICGRIIHAEDIVEIRDTVKLNYKTILVCERITEDLIPVLRIIDGVISESGSDLQEENLKLVNPNLVYIQNVPDACKILEDNLSVSIDGEQGLVYEGAIF